MMYAMTMVVDTDHANAHTTNETLLTNRISHSSRTTCRGDGAASNLIRTRRAQWHVPQVGDAKFKCDSPWYGAVGLDSERGLFLVLAPMRSVH